jgi:hypothetical protein
MGGEREQRRGREKPGGPYLGRAPLLPVAVESGASCWRWSSLEGGVQGDGDDGRLWGRAAPSRVFPTSQQLRSAGLVVGIEEAGGTPALDGDEVERAAADKPLLAAMDPGTCGGRAHHPASPN